MTEYNGNAGCSLCGARASSKNVATRSIFPIYTGDNQYLFQMYENCVMVEKGDKWSIKPHVRHRDKSDEPPTMREFIADAAKLLKPEELGQIFCNHHWMQDKGTATV